MTTIERLEKKYGIKVRKDFFSWESNKQLYKMYSADGCPWENGLTLKGLREECRRWEKSSLRSSRELTRQEREERRHKPGTNLRARPGRGLLLVIENDDGPERVFFYCHF